MLNLRSIKISALAIACCAGSSVLAAPSSLDVNYQKHGSGKTYTRAMFNQDVKDVEHYGNIGDGNQKIQIYPSGSNYKRLRVKFKKDKFGSSHLTGVATNLASNNKYTIKYKFRFMNDWQFVKGGKLPGLAGGSHPAGGKPRVDGMSIRLMWRRDSRWDGQYGGSTRNYLEAYHYWLGQYNRYKSEGDKYKHGDRTYLSDADKNRWYDLGMQVKINKGDGKGRLHIKLNGVSKYNREHRYLASGKNWKMHRLMHVFFYGGNSPDWAPSQDTHVLFDNLAVTRNDL